MDKASSFSQQNVLTIFIAPSKHVQVMWKTDLKSHHTTTIHLS